jgi:hypothetical protein
MDPQSTDVVSPLMSPCSEGSRFRRPSPDTSELSGRCIANVDAASTPPNRLVNGSITNIIEPAFSKHIAKPIRFEGPSKIDGSVRTEHTVEQAKMIGNALNIPFVGNGGEVERTSFRLLRFQKSQYLFV